MAITSFTINGVEVDPLFDHFDVRETEGGVSTLACGIISVGSPSLSFAVRQPIIVEEDNERIFAGQITQAMVSGYGGPNIYDVDTNAPQTLWTLTAEDHTRIADRVFITETVADGTTLKAFLTTLVGYLTSNGVTLHASQVDGPPLPDLEYTRVRLSEVLQKLSDATGYLWRIDYDKALRMWAPGDLAAPFHLDEDDDPAKWTGDVEVETILGDEFANRVTVVVGPITYENRVETFTGDGTTTIFQLTAQLTAHRGYVTDDTGTDPVTNFTLTTTEFQGSASWTYHPSNNTLERDAGPLPNGQVASITFDGFLYLTGSDEESADIATYGLVEYQEQRDDLLTQAAVDAYATELLAQRFAAAEQIVRYETRYPASTLRAGQEQTITAPSRGASGAYIIADLTVMAETPVTATYDAAGLGLIRTVTAKKNPKVGKYQSTYHDWLGGKQGGAVSIQTGGGGTGSAAPGIPFTSVQFNRSGAFGGDSAFIYYEDENSLIVGDDNAITAAAFAHCLIVGQYCEIADPS